VKKAWGRPSDTIVKVLNEAGLEQTVADMKADGGRLKPKESTDVAVKRPLPTAVSGDRQLPQRQSAWGKPPSDNTVMNILSRVEFQDNDSDEDVEELKPVEPGVLNTAELLLSAVLFCLRSNEFFLYNYSW
jgi:hypothetical protein